MSGRYLGDWILDEHDQPVPADESTARRWQREHPEQWTVARTELPQGTVSTVFLRVDHQWGAGPPLLFESMVFDPDTGQSTYCLRYATKAAALGGHALIVQALQDGMLEGSCDEEEDDEAAQEYDRP